MIKSKLAILLLSFIVISLALVGCRASPEKQLLGLWYSDEGTIEFFDDGTVILDGESVGQYVILDDSRLRIGNLVMSFEVSRDSLILSDANSRMVFRRSNSSTSQTSSSDRNTTLDATSSAAVNSPIVIWRVGSPYQGNTPPTSIPVDFQRLAQGLGHQVEVNAFPAMGFAETFTNAIQQNNSPDILVFDNYGIISGITTDLGHFAGIETNRQIMNSLVFVSESFRSLNPERGWEVLISTSRNHAVAKSLAQLVGGCTPGSIERISHLNANLRNEVSDAAKQVAEAYMRRDLSTLNQWSGGNYPRDSLSLPTEVYSVQQSDVCNIWGNSRLVFVYVPVLFESPQRVGQKDFTIVLKNTGNAWQVVLITDNKQYPEILQGELVLDQQHTGEINLSTPVLVAPPNQARLSRFPNRPDIEWSHNKENTTVYLVESQFDQRPNQGHWSGSHFVVYQISHFRGENMIVEAPFGVGRQPHRWRVWAIATTGQFTISEWRIVNYTN